jgi:hypothetical protein
VVIFFEYVITMKPAERLGSEIRISPPLFHSHTGLVEAGILGETVDLRRLEAQET